MKKILFILVLFFSAFTQGQITTFGSVSSPTDNGTSAASPVSVTPPSSMVAGDLVFVYVYARNASATFSVSNTGGQTWTQISTRQSATAVLSGAAYWCQFNGTWTADPSFTFSSTTNTNVVMHVFRPTGSTYTWALDNASGSSTTNVLTDFASNGNPQTPTIGDPSHASTVTIAVWNTDDDNSWGAIIGTSWTSLGNAQYRNTSGSDVSSSYGYIIKSSSSFIQAPTKSETVNGADGGIVGNFMFYETAPAAPGTPKQNNLILMGTGH